MTKSDPVVIAGAKRTAMGSFQGTLEKCSASVLGATAIRGAVEASGVDPQDIDEVLMGCVLTAGQGQAPARQAALKAGLSERTGCTTVNKMCGSGMQSVMLANDLLLANNNEVMVAGGMESMSNAPYLLSKARAGYRMGHDRVLDHMFVDGLEDGFGYGGLMGTFAEQCAQHYQFTRLAQDEFAVESLTRAKRATEDKTFETEIIPVEVKHKKNSVQVAQDEQPLTADIEKIPKLRPAFREDGTVTAANSSSISDGAAALVLTRMSYAERAGLTPLAVIIGHATYAQSPDWFTTAPIRAIERLFERTGWDQKAVDLYEINEAFAVVTMAAMRELDLPAYKVNVHGGACALGHPVGASGARIIVTLLNALHKYDLQRGVAALCIGGGEATAVALQRIAH